MISFLQNIINFFKLISANLIGLICGLAVSLLLVIILQMTIFKGVKINAIIIVIICLVFGFLGIFIQNKFFNKIADGTVSAKEEITIIEDTIADGWVNPAGGFDPDEIETSLTDSNCPTADDQIINLKCFDFGSLVCFSYLKNGLNENVIFLKTDKGLIVDGLFNMYAKYDDYFSLFNPFLSWVYDIDSFKWINSKNSAIAYNKHDRKLVSDYDNLISASNMAINPKTGKQSASFLINYGLFHSNTKKATEYAVKKACQLIGSNVLDNFVRFNSIELISSSDNAPVVVNSFYNFLYEQIKFEEYNTTKIIDGTSSLCLPIPFEEQHLYPIPEDKKSLYNNKDFYGVYKCNIGVELQYLRGNTLKETTDKVDGYKEEIIDDITITTITPKNNFSKLKLNFNNTSNIAIDSHDFKKYPVEILLSSRSINGYKSITIDSLNKFNKGVEILLNKNIEWSYSIKVSGINFETNQGNFKLVDDLSQITFNYSYSNDIVSVTLHFEISEDIDETLCDLKKYPLTINLSNSDYSKSLIIDYGVLTNSTYCQFFVPFGTYHFEINSNVLNFDNSSGELTVLIDSEFVFIVTNK